MCKDTRAVHPHSMGFVEQGTTHAIVDVDWGRYDEHVIQRGVHNRKSSLPLRWGHCIRNRIHISICGSKPPVVIG